MEEYVGTSLSNKDKFEKLDVLATVPMKMVFEGCEHLLGDLYDYALEKKLYLVEVDQAIENEYLKHKKGYDKCRTVYDDDKLRNLNAKVLSIVRSKLEKKVESR